MDSSFRRRAWGYVLLGWAAVSPPVAAQHFPFQPYPYSGLPQPVQYQMVQDYTPPPPTLTPDPTSPAPGYQGEPQDMAPHAPYPQGYAPAPALPVPAHAPYPMPESDESHGPTSVLPDAEAIFDGPVLHHGPAYLMNPLAHKRTFCFPRGTQTFQITGGEYFSPVLGGTSPSFNFAPTSIRFGRVYNFPRFHGIFSGCFEPLIEFSGAPITRGFGTYLVSATAMMRYNFTVPNSRVVPYAQVGLGILYTDAYKDQSQFLIGQAVEFPLSAGVGFRYFIKPCVSVDIEANFMHISNAGMDDRNTGVNAIGVLLGVSYFFPRR